MYVLKGGGNNTAGKRVVNMEYKEAGTADLADRPKEGVGLSNFMCLASSILSHAYRFVGGDGMIIHPPELGWVGLVGIILCVMPAWMNEVL